MKTIDKITTDNAVRSILSDNAKLRKMPSGERIINAGVTMAPSKRSGVVNVCPHATAACILVCVLWFAGRTVTKTVRAAATKRTRLWHFFPDIFYSRLQRELSALARRAAKLGATAFCRLNVASDIDHPATVAEENPTITFYDYTASVAKATAYGRGELPQNYHVAFSVKESTTFADAKVLHTLGVNLVVVFDSHYFGPRHRYGILPAEVIYRSRKTGETFATASVDGDVHDIRTPQYDGRGKTVALRAKGSADLRKRAAAMGFVKHFAEGAEWCERRHISRGSVVVELD